MRQNIEKTQNYIALIDQMANAIDPSREKAKESYMELPKEPKKGMVRYSTMMPSYRKSLSITSRPKRSLA